jgi:hypothetical protein
LGSVAGPIGRLRGLGGSLEEAREVEVKCRIKGGRFCFWQKPQYNKIEEIK